MEAVEQLWRAQVLLIEPSTKGWGQAAEVKDSGGAPLATSDADGTTQDAAGQLLVRAPLRDRPGKARDPSRVAADVVAADGTKLGELRVAKYRFMPRVRWLAVRIHDSDGAEVARLEARDKRGDELIVATDGREVATIAVDRVKRGLLRKLRVYRAQLSGEVSEAQRPLVLAAIIRYDAMLKAAMAASGTD